jgi:imidazolonepropionase-like amidohydrolase
MHDELAELVRLANMTPREALAAAAIRPARFLRVADLFGTLAPGKVADLVLLDMSRSLVRKALRSPTMR